jgi:outer membrane receptor protein involved in Fe transport
MVFILNRLYKQEEKLWDKNRFLRLFFIFVSLLCSNLYLWAGTTGKIAGRITDAETGESLPFVNIIVEGTTMGAASDPDGYYVILNIPPGRYDVGARIIGYQEYRITDVKVSIDFTTWLDFNLTPTTVEVEGITVTAERPLIKMDLTSTRAIVDADRIEALPVVEFEDIVNLQAGVVDGHFRGGRSSEVVYMLDGISITDPFSYDAMIDVDNSIIKELEVISGTFNAEYGQAMSGVVNIVTKEGGRKKLTGNVTTYIGDYVSIHNSTFLNIDEINPLSIYNIEATFGGLIPIFGDKLTFYANGRRYNNDGYLYGTRIFNPSDSSNFSVDDPDDWYVGATGDSAMIQMAPSLENSFFGKLTFKPSHENKFTYNFTWKNREFKEYSASFGLGNRYYSGHDFRYNPDGLPKFYDWSYNHILNWNHLISGNTFFELKVANSYRDVDAYLYKDSLDSRYVDPERLEDASNNAFLTGGTINGKFKRNTNSWIGKFDLTTQVTNIHLVKTGVEVRRHKLFLHEYEIIPKKDEAGNQIYPFEPDIPPINFTNHNKYTNYPFEAAAYIQDKIEFKDMIANIGVRFDYFDPRFKVPTELRDPNPNDPLRPDTINPFNPNNPIRVTGESWFSDVEPKMQVSPRIGVAYPISDMGVLHGSYGHFFQIPQFEYLYTDPEFEVYAAELQSRMGNADLEPQKTVIYELGLQQQLTDDISLDVTGFFKNIRNLLGIEIIETYIGSKYARYINKDYGNVKGITITLEGRYSEFLYASIDYTYQIAQGNSSDPDAVFWDAQANREPEKLLVPLDWDQTHTINGAATLGYQDKWAVSLIGRYGTGFPYTPTREDVRIARENSERKPARYNVDLRTYYNFKIGDINLSAFLNVYNLTDRMNEIDVYTDTGRAGYTIIPSPGVIRGINTLEEYLLRPNFYSEPRHFTVGVTIGF